MITDLLTRINTIAQKRAEELDYYVESRLQILKEDTDVSLRQLETLTPTIRKFRNKTTAAVLQQMADRYSVKHVPEANPLFIAESHSF